jgi:D-3-phosphoglycerate dehydrogenase
MPSDFQYKVFLTDYSDFLYPYAFEREELAKIGAQLILARCKSEDQVIDEGQGADVLLNNAIPITRRIIESLPACKLIVRYGIGVDHIDIQAATECHIIVANTPTYCVEEVSDHAVALLLACVRKIVTLDRIVKKGRWDTTKLWPIHRLRGQTLGLVGFGKIARRVVEKLMPFDPTCLAYDPYVPQQVAEEYGVALVGLEELLKESDLVSLHAPLTEETRHMIGQKEFKLMRPSAFLVNTSRGAVVNEQALYQALKQGWIAGAGLDVMEEEPPVEDNPLLQLDNVIITSHCASFSVESTEDLRREVCDAVVSVLTGRWPPAVVNPGVKPKVILERKST